ncbi:Uncharacterised protein [Cedecea neteri]|uniref:Uncharacterized protein n=1 Tax=Cedecea neteri TaxID=158822 RepID=A0A2X3IYK1_9ENTR|nr:hypothetical protein [Cedecea neteri]SQC92266.1 Uncharacterised protein [Cedecea neteri]
MNSTLQTFVGSLLQDDKTLVASYDLESLSPAQRSVLRLKALHQPGIYNYALQPFSLDFSQIQRLCIINGMGVTLGDSLIGIAALQAIRGLTLSGTKTHAKLSLRVGTLTIYPNSLLFG